MNQHIELSSGTLEYRDLGAGPAVVFVHGLLVDGRLWAPVAERLAGRGYRCIVPTLPLGSHRRPMKPDADLSPAGVAALVAELVAALDLDDVTLVGNDSGGVIAQLVAARHRERVGRLVLTDCDALEVFPPAGFGYIKWLPRIPGLLWLTARALLHLGFARRMKTAYGALTDRPLEPALTRSWVEPSARDRAVRRDVAKFIRGADRRLTLAVAEELGAFDRPALLVWSRDDRYFTLELAHRLAAHLPRAEVSPIEGASVFAALDYPDVVADAIAAHASSSVDASAAAAISRSTSSASSSISDSSRVARALARPR